MHKGLTVVALSLLTACVIASAQLHTFCNSAPLVQGGPTPSPTPQPWPNYDVLTHFKHPSGNRCGLEGSAPAGSETAAINRLRNRYTLPNSSEEVTLESLLDLPQGELGPDGASVINFPSSDSPHNQRAVTVTGIVTKASILGCGARSQTKEVLGLRLPWSGVESSNCYTSQQDLCSEQIFLKPDSNTDTENDHNLFVVQITERARRLAARGLLVSNIGKNWRVEVLRKLRDRRIRVSGWLFFNSEYRERNWKADPENKIGLPNTRETAWEIHPVMSIEVISPPEPHKPTRKTRRHK